MSGEGTLVIVHAITRFIRGGADENTLITCNGQAARGHRVHLVVGEETHDDMLARLDERVGVHRLGTLVRSIHPLNDMRALAALWSLFRALKPDIVHTHESKAGIIGRLAAWLASVPAIVHGVHILAFVGMRGPKRHLYLTLERLVAPMTDIFVDVSDGMRAACLGARVGRADNHHVVASGMDVSLYRDAAAPADWSELVPREAVAPDLRDGRPQFVLAAGALEPRKRIGEFLEVFGRITARCPNAVLLIAGDGMLREKITRRIAALGLDGRALLLGHRDDLERLIALADVCVHTAMREGLPRVVVQYVMAGRPVVATRLPGIERVVADGGNGCLIAAERLDEVEAKIVDLLRKPDLRMSFAAAARAIDVSEWDASLMVERIETLYAETMKEQGALRGSQRRGNAPATLPSAEP